MMPLHLYTLFHLNLAYSSIDEAQHAEVIRRCYWPLLRLAEERRVPIAVEAPVWTLERIAALDPAWLDTLRRLIWAGRCELVASGHVQLIGPLVPAAVNRANLRLGQEGYMRLLGVRPQLALVNEQAYASGLVGHYREAGFRGVIMEWDNAASHHRWPAALRYLPQRAEGDDGEIPLLWTTSVAFQKFQRYAHGEYELEEYLTYLHGHQGERERLLALYSNDAEIFDFRPGRYVHEPPIETEEWRRIERLFDALRQAPEFDLTLPSTLLRSLGELPGANNPLRLESAGQPIPVKKQGKYNVTRWAVSGRDDLGINSACWRLYRAIEGRDDDEAWRELCELWASDFRTHITDTRWAAYRERLAAAEARYGSLRQLSPLAPPPPQPPRQMVRKGRFLELRSGESALRLNCQRGLAIDALAFDGDLDNPLFLTLPHGYFDHIQWVADFYSGHLVLEYPARPKVTDLMPVEPQVGEAQGAIHVQATIETPLGPVEKRLTLRADPPRLELEYRLHWRQLPIATLRLGHLTLNPERFRCDHLELHAHCGGSLPERLRMEQEEIRHGTAVSHSVSARHGFPLTGETLQLRDGHHAVRIEVDNACAMPLGLFALEPVDGSHFARLSFTIREMDETSRETLLTEPLVFRMAVESVPPGERLA